jgi:hypothetical protein
MSMPMFRVELTCPGCGQAWIWIGAHVRGGESWHAPAEPRIVVQCRACALDFETALPAGYERGGLRTPEEWARDQEHIRQRGRTIGAALLSRHDPNEVPAPRAEPPPLPIEAQHDEARALAHRLMSVIEHYHAEAVRLGRKQKDLRVRLAAQVAKAREGYTSRVAAPVRETSSYFEDALLAVLAEGDPEALGPSA